MLLEDLFGGKTIYANVRFKNIPKEFKKKIIYLTKENIHMIFENIKNGTWDLQNSTLFIQEAHNYVDSRRSSSEKNRIFSYFLLQSRHSGRGSLDVIYDTQEISQVDIRLRRNTDYIVHPTIIQWIHEKGNKRPSKIRMEIITKLGHKWVNGYKTVDVSDACRMYDTHELVDF